MERGRVLAGLGKQLARHPLDAGRVLRRQVNQRRQVGRAPLQPGGRALALVVGRFEPAQRVVGAAELAGVAAELAHQVVRRMALGQVGLEQGITLGPQPGIGQQTGTGGDYRLALVAVADLAVVTRHMIAHPLHQRGRQLGPQGVLGLVDAGQRNAGRQRVQPVGARQAGVGLQPLQRRLEGGGNAAPVGTGLGRQRLGDLGGVVHHHVHLRPADRRIGQQRLHPRAQRGVGLDALAVVALGQRLEQQPGGGGGLGGRAGQRQLRQQPGALGRRHQLRLVGVPGVKGQ